MPEQTATDTKQFTITRVFDAPRDLVWQAWTTEADAAAWWHPRGIEIKPGSVALDARVGGRYAYTMVNPADGQEYPTAGVYREVTPPERLVFTWGSPGDRDEDAPVITVELRELPEDRTEMRFHLLGTEGAPGDENVYDGWDSAFDILAEQLSGGGRLMSRLTVEQIVSVDGYAADADGGIGFFEAVDEVDSNDADQLAFLEHVDAILLGATTYRMFADYWPAADPEVERVAEPIKRLPKFVVSNRLTEAPWGDDSAEILSGDGAAAVAELKQRYEGIIVWGSLTLADSLFRAGLVDELRLRIVPVLIGAGRPFTPADLGERRLALDHVVARPTGHVGVTYRVR